MKGNCSPATVRMAVLLVGPALANLCKTAFTKKCLNLTWLQNRRPRQLSDPDRLHPNELRLQRWLSILEQHSEDFL